ncbi:MAG: VWA domain-containing protein [Myxococcales bacterium]|nr:VWA domain-containing protein [Myxococcales bacterium]
MNRLPALLVCSSLALLSCSGSKTHTGSALVASERPLVLLDGVVDARLAGATADAPLVVGAPTKGVVGLVARKHARLSFAGGVLHLRAGARLDLGETKGRLRLTLHEGELRVTGIDLDVSGPLGAYEPAATVGDDVLVAKVGGETKVLRTATHLVEAQWSLAPAGEPVGIGSLEVSDPTPAGKPIATPRLALVSLAVRAKAIDDLVETEVEHVFHSDDERRLEGTFRFPLPDGAMLTGLSLEIDGKMMDGELVESKKAEQVFNEVVDQMQDPALLSWEHGSTFKLRVFPIEPKSNKKVVLRFLSPLSRTAAGTAWVYPTAAPAMQGSVARFTVDAFGSKVLDRKDFVPGEDVIVARAVDAPLLREVRPEGTFTRVVVKPAWGSLPAEKPATGPRSLVIVVDTSRSALEGRALALDSARALVDGLGEDDRFQVLAADVAVRPVTADWQPKASRDATLAALAKLDFDGATDLGAALSAAGQLTKGRARAHVVLVGDGTPTGARPTRWCSARRSTRPRRRRSRRSRWARARTSTRCRSSPGSREAGCRSPARSPRRTRPRSRCSPPTVCAASRASPRRRARTRWCSRRRPRCSRARTSSPTCTPRRTTSPPTRSCSAPGFTQTVALTSPTPGASVARRWAMAEIGRLEATAGKREDIVQLSLSYQVMSRHTSFLVLESEEMYAKYAIVRKNGPNAPKVTGADLEGGGKPHMDPDHLQPGDPEVRIFAPKDSKSVVLVLPTGETLPATWDVGAQAWTVRFLVDKETPDGTYELVVRITRHDDSVEVQRLEYVVDTQKPTLEVTMTKKGASFEIHAVQVITAHELDAQIPKARRKGTLAEDQKAFATVLLDVKRVEVAMPDGQLLSLSASKLGDLHGTWTPKAPVTGKVTLKVVAVDRALNQNAFDVTVDPGAP